MYQTNAITRHGEHGNALLSRWPVVWHKHEDMSDHRFEQRGLLHVHVQAHGVPIHVIVVHLGLIPASRARQVQQLATYIARDVPPDAPLIVAGDFNDWGNQMRLALNRIHMQAFDKPGARTYPSRLPLAQLDYVYARGLKPVGLEVPRGRIWWRMSDHLPLLAEFEL